MLTTHEPEDKDINPTLQAICVGDPANHEAHAAAGQHIHGSWHVEAVQYNLVFLPDSADIDASACL